MRGIIRKLFDRGGVGGGPQGPAALPVRIALGVVLMVATGYFLKEVHPHYGIQHWLFWRYLAYWGVALLLTLTCMSVGNLIVTGVLGRSLPLLEHVAISLMAGLYAFELTMFFAGVFGLYRTSLFMAVPLGLTALGAPALYTWGKRAFRHLRHARARAKPLPAWQFPALAVGCLCLFAIYFVLLTPENVQFDARWKHLALAEEYVAYGGIRRFHIGVTTATRGHFSSFLYAWAFLLPGGKLFDHMVLSQHLEFVVFLWTTMLGIPAMIRRLAPRADVRLVWVVRFVFPGVLVYDSSLSAGADHLGAAFCPPIFLLVLHCYRKHLDARMAILLCLMLSGAAMVKETIAMMLLPGAVLAVAFRSVTMLFRPELRRPALLTPLICIGACLLFTAPHWVHNWWWYGDPLYPAGGALFNQRPWTADSSYMLKYGYAEYQFWRPERTLDGVIETLKAALTFSFVPHNYKSYIGVRPVFGSLFTLSLVALPFLRKTKRIWMLVLWVHLGIIIWYWVHHQDRYLQGIMPLMAATTGATFVLIWRTGRTVVRSTMVVLIAMQVVWGADAYFAHKHAMAGSAIKKTIDLLSQGKDKASESRLRAQTAWVALGEQLPKDARVLLHENHNHLGLKRTQVSDWGTFQYGLSYGLLDTPRDVYDKYRELGVTHMHWRDKSRSHDSLKGDIMFHYFVERYGEPMGRFAGGELAAMPAEPPPDEMPQWVLMLGCGRPMRSGIYHLNDLHVPVFGPKAEQQPAPRTLMQNESEAADLAQAADFVVVDPRCANKFSGWQSSMRQLFTRGKASKLRNPHYQVFVKTSLVGAARTPTPARGDELPPDDLPDDDEE